MPIEGRPPQEASVRRTYTVSIMASHRQVVLVRTCQLALRHNVDIIDVRIPTCWDSSQPSAFTVVVQSLGQGAIDRLEQGISRLVDVVEVTTDECQPIVGLVEESNHSGVARGMTASVVAR